MPLKTTTGHDGGEVHRNITEYTLEGPGGEVESLLRVRTAEFDGIGSECPFCGGLEFTRFATRGDHMGGSPAISRTDYGSATRTLFIGCKECRRRLFQEPLAGQMFDLSKYTDEQVADLVDQQEK